jgi:hypothetical protein
MIKRQQQEPSGLISPVFRFKEACFRMPYGTDQTSKVDCLVLGTYVFPLAMFFLAIATQYFPDLSSGFWFKESEHATTMGFPIKSIIAEILHFCSSPHPPSRCFVKQKFHSRRNHRFVSRSETLARTPYIPGLKVRGFTAAFRQSF